MKILKICLIFLVLIGNKARSQNDTSEYLCATVNKIDTTDYYLVIKATTGKNNTRITILSQWNEPNKLVGKYKDSCKVKIGHTYKFHLEKTNRVRTGKDSYFFINLQKLYWGKVLLVDEGQIPYIALNMNRSMLYRW
jgi:hypothetical protein